MQDPNFQDLIQSSLGRIEYLIKRSSEQRNDLFAFSLTHELIMEEILLLISILKPYNKEDFQNIYRKNLSQHISIDPLALVFSSGSGSLDAIIRGLIAYKPDLKIASSAQAYFETNLYLSDLKTRSIHADQKIPQALLSESDPLLLSIEEMVITKFVPDLMLLEKHFNISFSAKEYRQVDLISAIQKLLESRESKIPLTIALDSTLDKLHSKEIDRLISNFHEQIIQEKLNIILYRSSNKFDQLGMDKLNSGYVILYSADQQLRETFSRLTGQVKGLDYQLLTHLHKYAHHEIHNYNKLHYINAELLYKDLGLLVNNPDSFLKIVPKYDKKLFFLDFRYPAIKIETIADEFRTLFFHHMIQNGRLNGIPIIRRASFGYNETTIGDGGPNVIRLSLGTHNIEDIQKIAEFTLALEAKIQQYLQSIGKNMSEDLSEAELQGLLKSIEKENVRRNKLIDPICNKWD